MRLVINFNRAQVCASPGGSAGSIPAGWQDYLVDITTYGRSARPHRGTAHTVFLDWRVMCESLTRLGNSERAPALQQHIGDELRRLLDRAEWAQHEERIRHTVAAGRSVHVTVTSNAAEIYRLPWELLTFADEGSRVLAHESVVIGYAVPSARARAARNGQASPQPARVLFAWSTAGGSLPLSQHRRVLLEVCGADRVSEIADVTLGQLRATLRACEPGEALALHILCHGVAHDGGHGLLWNADSGGVATVSAADLNDALAPHADSLSMVILCACEGASAGDWARPLGSVAQEVHRLGIPWVIGARYPLTRRGSTSFARAFYGGLLAHGASVERAYARARGELFLDTEQRDYIGLQLYARDEHRGIQTEPRAGQLWRVPELPPHFLDRPADTQRIIAALCEPSAEPAGTDTVIHGLHGMSGIGKTVLASAVARADAISEHFVDGIYWLSMGLQPKLTMLQNDLAAEIGLEYVFRSPVDGRQKLAAALAGKRVLLILDGVWEADHVEALEVVDAAGRILITTRSVDVLSWRRAENHRVDAMTDEQAHALLAGWTDVASVDLPPEAGQVAEACGRLPLALAIAGSLVCRPGGTWKHVLRLVQGAKLDKLSGRIPAYPYRNVYQAIAASVAEMVEDTSAPQAELCYQELAVFAEDDRVPESALRVLWGRRGLDADDVRDLACALASYSLVRLDVHDAFASVQLHDIQRAYVCACYGDLTALHGEFVDAYAALCPDGDLARGPQDGRARAYFFARLPYHLSGADRLVELLRLLGRYEWIDGKLRTCGVAELIADYEQITDLHSQNHGLVLIRDALRLASHVLARDPSQLAGQLIGRLDQYGCEDGAVRSLLDGARRVSACPWLCPLSASLTPPGGPLLHTFQGHSAAVRAVALSADCARVLSGSDDGTALLWDTCSGALLGTFAGHSDRVRAVALSGDGTRALSGSSDRTMKLWDTRRGTLLHTFTGHLGSVMTVTLSKDGERALSGSVDATMKVWDTRSGAVLQTVAGHGGPVMAVALSDDGALALSGSLDATMKLWDVRSGALIRTFQGHSDHVRAVALSRDGERALSGSSDQTVKLWDLHSGAVLRTFVGHSDWVRAVALSEDGTRALSGSSDRSLKLWDTSSGALLRTFESHSSRVRAVALSGNGQLACSGSSDWTVKLWDIQSGIRPQAAPHHALSVMAVAASVDGRRALSGSYDRTVKLWDASNGALLRTFEGHTDRVRSVALSGDGTRALSGSYDWTARLWDTRTGTLQQTLVGHTASVVAVALSADGTTALSGSYDRTAILWDVHSGALVRTFVGHSDCVRAVALSDDGAFALSASSDKTIRLWDARVGALLRTFEEHASSVMAVVLSADGERVLSGSFDRTVKLWDVHTGRVVRTFDGHSAPVTSVAMSRDGRRAVSGSYDRTLKMWDTATGRIVAIFSADWSVCGSALASEGQTLVVAGDRSGCVHFLRLFEPGSEQPPVRPSAAPAARSSIIK